jgi:predicted phage-related endonuclease
MSTKDVASKAAELKELKAMQEELAAEISSIEDTIKAELTARGTDELQAGPFKIRWTFVKSNRLDQTAIKNELPDIYARYCKKSESRRFCVA